jgi:hypothetical protein
MKGKAMSEKETRKKLMDFAKKVGAAEDLQHVFDKWDKLLALTSPNEKKDVAKMAVLEVQALLDIHADTGNGLTIDDEIIIKGRIK